MYKKGPELVSLLPATQHPPQEVHPLHHHLHLHLHLHPLHLHPLHHQEVGGNLHTSEC